MTDPVLLGILSSCCYDLMKKVLPKTNKIDREFSDIFYKSIYETIEKYKNLNELHLEVLFESEKVNQEIEKFKQIQNIDLKIFQNEFEALLDKDELEVEPKEVLYYFFRRLEINMGEKQGLRENLNIFYLKDMREKTINIGKKLEEVSSNVKSIEDSIVNKGNEELIEELIKVGKKLQENKDFESAIEYYEKAKSKLKEEDKKFLTKILVGEAVCYENKGNHARVLKLLSEAENIEPTNPIILADLASVHRFTKNIEKAEYYAKNALDFDENNILALTVMALIEYERKNVEEALRLLKKASILEKDSYSTYVISYIYANEEDYDDAKHFGIKALELDPLNAYYHSHLGVIFFKTSFPGKKILYENDMKNINLKFLDKAIRCLEKSIELNYQQGNSHLNSENYFNLASVYLLKNNLEKSIFYSNKAIEMGEVSNEVYINLGAAYFNGMNYDKVIQTYEPLIKRGIKDLGVRGTLGLAYMYENNLGKAESIFSELILEYPNDLNLYISLAEIYEFKGDLEKGIKILSEAIEIIGPNWRIHHILGRLYSQLNLYEKAVEELKKSIKKNEKAIGPRQDLIDLYIELEMPQYAEKYANDLIKIDSNNKGYNFYKLAYIYHKLKNYAESINYANFALNEGYKDVGVYQLLCVSLLYSKEMSKAKDAFDKALNEFPEDLKLNVNFSKFLFESGDIDKAIDVLNSIIQHNPNFISPYLFLSNILILKGDFEKAINLCKKAVSFDPQNEDAHFSLAISLLHSGQIDDSVKEMNLVKEINPNTHYVRTLDLEEIEIFFENQSIYWEKIINSYQKGKITIGKSAELLKSEVVNLLSSFNNKKVAEELNIPKDELLELENVCIGKRNAVVDMTILGLLVQNDEIYLIKKMFDYIYISKEVEEEILKGISGGNLLYRKIGENLEILSGGWLKNLISNKKTIEVLSKLVPEASKTELSLMALALDNNYLFVTDDILLRRHLKKIGISSCGLVGIIKYSVNQKIISKHDCVKMLKKIINNGYSPSIDNQELSSHLLNN